jgi:hypothetical protein
MRYVLTYMAFAWPQEAVAAVSLAFDGCSIHLRRLRDQLSSGVARCTFYVDAPCLLEDVEGWQNAIAVGHEVGNLALHGATDNDGLIARMSRSAIEAEVDELKTLLAGTFGAGEHSAAMPLVKTWPDEQGLPVVPDVVRRTILRLNEDALMPALVERYPVTRGSDAGMNSPSQPFSTVNTYRIDGMDAVSVGLLAQIAISQGSWVVFSTREPDAEAILQTVKWLGRQPVWLAPVIEVATHLRDSLRDPAPIQKQ